MSDTVYVVYCYEKRATEDDYEKGELPNTDSYFSMDLAVREKSLVKAMDKMASTLGVDCDSYDIYAIASECYDGRITFSRMENDDGYEPTQAELDAWKAGRTRLWTADYFCRVEKTFEMGDDEIAETIAKEKQEVAS